MPTSPIPLSDSFLYAASNFSIYDVVYPVVKLDKNDKPIEILGSCFSIGSCGIYATAAHLFDEFQILHNHRKRNDHKIDQFDFSDLCDKENMRCGIVHFNRDEFLGITLIDALTMCQSHDVALLFSLNDYRGRRQPFLPIIETPSLNDEITVVGYPQNHNNMKISEEDGVDLEFDLVLHLSEGIISQSHTAKRDPFLAFYPCFEMTALMNLGQSGGPILDKNRIGVVGINSRSMSSSEEYEEDYSIGAWMGMALDELICFDNLEFRNDEGKTISLYNTTLRNLSNEGVVKII